ncbi:DUF748 domain-containing protein [Accumulibacter sp.]|uniref:DUF748 domain-containing protein n=1 Tax=Accumulibacter sp. TaxID=2053492 RepID=UPI0028C4C8E2|nr:DUF748 domain-containing protein [Accumulibacter sp.]
MFSVLGFFALPPFVKSTLSTKLSEALSRPVAIESVSINPFTLTVQVAGLVIQEKGGGETLAGFERLDINAEWSSLWRRGPVISELKVVAPTFRLVRLADGGFNVSDLIDEFTATPASEDPTPVFSLNNIQITGGKLEFDDQMRADKHVISEIDLSLPSISSLPQAVAIFVEPSFSASIDGSPLRAQGRSKPFDHSLESELTFDLRQVQVAKYIDYLPFKLPIKVISGALDTELKLAFQRHDEDRSTLVLSGKLALKEVLVKDTAGAPLFSVQALDVALETIDPLNGKYAIERISVDSPEIHARVTPQGTINWADFFRNEPAGRGSPAPAPAAGKNEKSAPLEWSLAEAKITGGALRWLDESHGEPFNASVDGLAVSLKKFDSKGGAPAEFDLAFGMEAGQWVKLDAFSVKGGRLDLAKREVFIDQVTSRGAKLLIRRLADGSVEFVKTPALRAVEASQSDSSTPWKLTVGKYRGEDLGLRVEDAAMSPVVVHTIDEMNVEAENLSTGSGTTAKVATRFRVNKKGEAEVGGTVQIFPLNSDLKISLKKLELVPLQPYFTERLNVVLTGGQVSLSGDVRLQQLAESAAEAGKLAGGFSGQLAVGGFSAVAKVDSSDFLNWKSLAMGHVDLRLNPNSVSIGEVGLTDFFARAVINPQGQLNLLHIVRQADARPVAVVPKAAEPAASVVSAEGKAVAPVPVGRQPRLPIKIGKITLQGGDIKFSDNFIKPNYSANLNKIGGAISGMSSAADSVATLDLRGSYDDIAPLKVMGQFNPLIAAPYLDLQADVKGIEMTALSPYSGKYAGYAIDKGKLSLFVKYKIENNQLTAENRVFLDQLTFGDRVDSPEATKLPVSLAVALLKNAKGEIDINLPVAGSLDDPEFSIGGLLGSLVGNLLLKAVTSPFALLGSIFGGGEELSNVEFDFGQAAITPPAQQRLESLSKALLDRPALKLEIEGFADPENDPEGLKRDRLNRKLQTLKSGVLKKKEAQSSTADVVEINAKEYPDLLERVYRAEDFEKPRNMVGMVKTLPVDEMEKLLLANSVLEESDLRELANRRAKVVRDWLLAHQIPAERLFLLPPKVGKPGGKSDSSVVAGGNRVVFSLE